MGRLFNPGLGEKLDRCTILEMKIAHALEQHTGLHTQFEGELQSITDLLPAFTTEIHDLHEQLIEVNQRLWDAEDTMRDCRSRELHLTTTELLDVGKLGMQCQELNDQRSTIIAELNLGNNDGWIEKAETEVV